MAALFLMTAIVAMAGQPTAPAAPGGRVTLASVIGCPPAAAEIVAVPATLFTRIAIDPGMLERIGTRFRVGTPGLSGIAYFLRTTSLMPLPADAPRPKFEVRTALIVTCADGTTRRAYVQAVWSGTPPHPLVVVDGRLFESEGDPAERLRNIALFAGSRDR